MANRTRYRSEVEPFWGWYKARLNPRACSSKKVTPCISTPEPERRDPGIARLTQAQNRFVLKDPRKAFLLKVCIQLPEVRVWCTYMHHYAQHDFGESCDSCSCLCVTNVCLRSAV